jgi:excisionase family DNA binding protein
MERLLLTAQEAAQALGVSRTKIYDLMRSGRLRSVKIGGSRRIPVDALAELVDELAEAS